MPLDDDIIDLCDSSDDENENYLNDVKKGSVSSRPINQSSIVRNCKNARKRCVGLRPRNQPSDHDSIISISSTEDDVAKSSGAADNAGGTQKLIIPSRRNRRGGDGYRLKEGEKIVWATETETGSSHPAIILHPQPEPPQGNAEPSQGMVCVKWLNTNGYVWIPRSNIRSEIYRQRTVGKSERLSSDCIGDGNEVNKKMKGAYIHGRKISTRKRTAPNRYFDSIAKASRLACERECRFLIGKKKKAAKKGRTTCCTDVESIAKSKGANELPENVRAAIVVARAQMASQKKHSSNDNFDGEWWRKYRDGRRDQCVPVLRVSCGDDCSAFSDVTLELQKHGDGYECESAYNNTRLVTLQQCHVCASHVHHHSHIDKLLGQLGAVGNNEQVDDAFWRNFATFVRRFKVLLQGLEDDSCSEGMSIFYHTCATNERPNPIFTVAKLIQLFGGLCHIIATVCDQTQDINTTLLELLFCPWQKTRVSTEESLKKTVLQYPWRYPNDCGVILQVLHIATFEIVNSREDFELPENIDQLLGVTFGLQCLQMMARNIYFDSKMKLENVFNFLDRQLESNKKCIKRHCTLKHRPLVECHVCGVKFHKNCLYGNSAINQVYCPPCNASAQLLGAARKNQLSGIYSLVVKKGASSLQPLFETPHNETALHAVIHSNNYNLASMLLFGCHLLLTCDDSLIGWDLPKIAWGKDDKLRVPFECGIDVIKKSLDVRPPVEICLLLCSRGAQGKQEDIQKALHKRQSAMMVIHDMGNKQAMLKSDISVGIEPLAVPVDGNSIMPSFIYVSKSVESRCTAIRWFDCRCGKGKQLMPFEGDCTTNSLKILHRNQSIPASWKIYCNYLCECRSKQGRSGPNGRKCECQLAEEGVHPGLEVFETFDGRGYGIRVRKGWSITKDEILCHYSGEIITSAEAKRRDQKYLKSQVGSYIIDIDEKGQYCIDATHFRSVAAFINHSCSEPNCRLFKALGSHLDVNFPIIGLRAKEDIGDLTELTFNYGQKPSGVCVECQGVHCLCKHCKKCCEESVHRTT